MAASTYKRALALVLAHEGGYVDHPKDPGGPTNRGVTQRVYDAFRKLHGSPLKSVRYIDETEVADIYKRQYWCLVRGDDLPVGLDYAVFDFAVNSGVSRAIRYLQRTVGTDDDAVIGNGTMVAIFEADRKRGFEVAFDLCNNRMAFLRSLSTFPTFGKGWTRRVCGSQLGAQITDNGVIDYAMILAQAVRKPEITPPMPVMPNPIGTNEGEVAAKAISDDYFTWPMAEQNDYLNKLILG